MSHLPAPRRTSRRRFIQTTAAAGAGFWAAGGLRRRCRVTLYTDSSYLQKGVTEWLDGWIRRGWKTSSRKPVKNRDLWERLDAVRGKHDISWRWVRGHAGHDGNERADELANIALDELESRGFELE